MESTIKFIWVFLSIIFLTTNCGNAPQEPKSESPAEKLASAVSTKAPAQVSFEEFLVKFEPAESWENWPEEAQDPLVLGGEAFEAEELNLLLSVMFSTIESKFHPFIPVEKLKQLHPKEEPTKDPYHSYTFHGFKKITFDNFILAAVFAKKKEFDYDNEYHAHPFYLITYTKEGNIIDDYVWWIIEDDALQVWTDIDVAGDTLLTGRKESVNDSKLEKISSKTILTKQGRFETVFSERAE